MSGRSGRRPHAKKSLGQNFLIDSNIQRKIVEALGAGPEDEVLEIGPGPGALTDHLVGTVRRLWLAELDDRFAKELEERYGARSDVVVVPGDVLETGLKERVEEAERLRVIGNIPYNVTTPILFWLLERPRPRDAVLMVQREVADRLLADPGSREYGALAVGVRSVAEVERVRHVPRTAFRPAPRVDSTVVRITPIRPHPLSPIEERNLRSLSRLCFQWRRKQMRKILRDHPDAGLSAEELEAVSRLGGWDLSRRPETFSPEEFIRMARWWEAR